MPTRTDAEWLAALRASGAEQAAALADLRVLLLHAAAFALRRSRGHHGGPDPAAADTLAEDCAQEALLAILQRLDDFRGDSRFTTWAYAFAVNIALVAARRERWRRVPLDELLAGAGTPPRALVPSAADPQRRALQASVLAAVRDVFEHDLTERQRQALGAIVFHGVPLDEVARHWGSSRNAVYKLLHDARRKLRAQLQKRGFDVQETLDLFSSGG